MSLTSPRLYSDVQLNISINLIFNPKKEAQTTKIQHFRTWQYGYRENCSEKGHKQENQNKGVANQKLSRGYPKTNFKVVFDENARKEFLTGFRKRKDERRKQWKEKIDRQLKNEIKKIKNDTKSKVP